MVQTRAQAAAKTESVINEPVKKASTAKVVKNGHRSAKKLGSAKPISTVTSTPADKLARQVTKHSFVPASPSEHPFAFSEEPPLFFGLIQERLCYWNPPGSSSAGPPDPSLLTYRLLLQATLWNQTSGRAALPVLSQLLALYPTPQAIANADLEELTNLLYPIGLYNQRAKRLISLGQAWQANPPSAGRRYRKKGYRDKKSKDQHRDGTGEVKENNEWEIGHLPGVGTYALDSWRMFGRDRLLGVQEQVDKGEREPEWKKVHGELLDKDLKAWLEWRWAIEGWKWNDQTGRKTRLKEEDAT